jgi:hypothetical protein
MPFVMTPLPVSVHSCASAVGSHRSSRIGWPLPLACQHRPGCPTGLICTGPMFLLPAADAGTPPASIAAMVRPAAAINR